MKKDKNIHQINIRIQEELYEFLLTYAKENYKTVTGVLREIIAKLYKESQLPTVIKPDNK